MKVTLVNPPTLYRGSHPATDAGSACCQPYFAKLLSHDNKKIGGRSTLPGEHLGLQSITACLRKSGHEVRIVDACIEFHSSLNATLNLVLQEHSDIIGISGPADVYGEVVWLARNLRRRGFGGWIVIGHDHATLNDVQILEHETSIDGVLRGEAEGSMIALVDAIGSGIGVNSVPRLTWRGPIGIVRNRSGEAINLNDLPFPSRDNTNRVLGHGMSSSIFTKRGCPYSCSFCTTGQICDAVGNKHADRWRAKSPIFAAEEFLGLVEQFSLKHLTIVDDVFVARDAASRAWAGTFAQHLIDNGNTASFMIDCRVDSIERDLFGLLHRAGLRRVFVGVESASKVALGSYQKSYESNSIDSAFELLDGLAIDFILGFIYFSPFENIDGLKHSARFLRTINSDDFSLHLQHMRVYSGTKLEKHLRKAGLLEGEFPFFQARFSDRRVKHVAELVRALGRRVYELIADFEPLDPCVSRKLFALFNDHVVELLEAKDGSDLVDAWLVDASEKMGTWLLTTIDRCEMQCS